MQLLQDPSYLRVRDVSSYWSLSFLLIHQNPAYTMFIIMLVTFPTYLVLLDFILIISGQEQYLRSSRHLFSLVFYVFTPVLSTHPPQHPVLKQPPPEAPDLAFSSL